MRRYISALVTFWAVWRSQGSGRLKVSATGKGQFLCHLMTQNHIALSHSTRTWKWKWSWADYDWAKLLCCLLCICLVFAKMDAAWSVGRWRCSNISWWLILSIISAEYISWSPRSSGHQEPNLSSVYELICGEFLQNPEGEDYSGAIEICIFNWVPL